MFRLACRIAKHSLAYMKRAILSAIAICAGMLHVGSASASLVWSWEIDNAVQTVSPTDVIQFRGTLFNDPTSTVTITGWDGMADEAQPISLLAAQGDFTPDKYTEDDGPIGAATFDSQFNGVSIAPGQSFSFILYNLIPVSGGAPEGVYTAPFNNLLVDGSALEGGAVQVTVVPLPATLLLLISGLLLPMLISLPSWQEYGRAARGPRP